MKKSTKNSRERLILQIKKSSLSINMFTMVLVCVKVRPEWLEFESLLDAYENLINEFEIVLNSKKEVTPELISTAKTFQNVLEIFKKHPDSQREDIRELTDIAEKDVKAILSGNI